VPVDVLKGEPKSPEHMQRHPFGKVPVVDVNGFRGIETPAITRYLDTVLPGTSLMPHDPKDVAHMDMVVSIIDSYAYAALIGGVVAYHLFPDFVSGKNKKMHHAGLENGKKAVAELMKLKESSPYRFASSRKSFQQVLSAMPTGCHKST
jgi:glutathione S-transferase